MTVGDCMFYVVILRYENKGAMIEEMYAWTVSL